MICEDCYSKYESKNILTFKKATYMAIIYICSIDLKKVFSFKISEEVNRELTNFINIYINEIMS